ncbi:hypothetical protein [Nitrosophilus labii]|uniref:hypothetical protein n=1 Tax=Nitrosophilus labii TaxID=2706014 RepID=UPI001656F61B|nr:hypothetical protein [Nitrosophilus labii]
MSFWDREYTKTKLADLADILGVSRQMLYKKLASDDERDKPFKELILLATTIDKKELEKKLKQIRKDYKRNFEKEYVKWLKSELAKYENTIVHKAKEE